MSLAAPWVRIRGHQRIRRADLKRAGPLVAGVAERGNVHGQIERTSDAHVCAHLRRVRAVHSQTASGRITDVAERVVQPAVAGAGEKTCSRHVMTVVVLNGGDGTSGSGAANARATGLDPRRLLRGLGGPKGAR